jgi:hypothetical protein
LAGTKPLGAGGHAARYGCPLPTAGPVDTTPLEAPTFVCPVMPVAGVTPLADPAMPWLSGPVGPGCMVGGGLVEFALRILPLCIGGGAITWGWLDGGFITNGLTGRRAVQP